MHLCPRALRPHSRQLPRQQIALQQHHMVPLIPQLFQLRGTQQRIEGPQVVHAARAYVCQPRIIRQKRMAGFRQMRQTYHTLSALEQPF